MHSSTFVWSRLSLTRDPAKFPGHAGAERNADVCSVAYMEHRHHGGGRNPQRFLQKKSAKKGKGALGATPSSSALGHEGLRGNAEQGGGGGCSDGGDDGSAGDGGDDEFGEGEEEEEEDGNESDYV